MPDKYGNDYRDCFVCSDVVAYGASERKYDGQLFHTDCLIQMLKDNIHELEKPMALDEAKAVAQQAVKRLANCTFKEAINDVWAAAVNKIIQNEHYGFLKWLAEEKNLFVCRLYEDEKKLLIAQETRDELINEYIVFRKKT